MIPQTFAEPRSPLKSRAEAAIGGELNKRPTHQYNYSVFALNTQLIYCHYVQLVDTTCMEELTMKQS